MYEPKWDGFRCLIFRDEENIFLQSRTGKSPTSAFPEIVAAFQTLSPKRLVLDGELALPTKDSFSFWAGLTAWGLPEIGFLATGLVGMAKKTSAL
jgi:ATP-dependent DNA ligase